MAATQGSSSSVPAHSVKILKFSLKFKFPQFPKKKTFGSRCLMTEWVLVMFDEDTGADGPVGLLCGNRMACHTTLAVFSCASSHLLPSWVQLCPRASSTSHLPWLELRNSLMRQKVFVQHQAQSWAAWRWRSPGSFLGSGVAHTVSTVH